MRIVALASGSSGNALLVDDGQTRILVDCGIGPRTLVQRLRTCGIRPQEIDALLITHEHIDHVSGIAQAVTRWRWPVFGSAGTLRALPAAVRTASQVASGRFRCGGMDIEAIPVSHDAAQPTAYALTARALGIRAGIAQDLGETSDRLVAAFRGSQFLCIEANHDAEMLRRGPYPDMLKARVASSAGHLSNDQATAFIDAVATPALRAVLLLHLSEVNNTPAIACAATRRGISRRARLASLAAAIRRAPSPAVGELHTMQLALAI